MSNFNGRRSGILLNGKIQLLNRDAPGGINFIPAVIGLFAAAEVYNQISLKRYEMRRVENKEILNRMKVKLPSFFELWPIKPSMLRSGIVGTWIGILPGVGATTAAIVGYAQSVRFSKRPELFGTGVVEGVAAAETANNAATEGAMIPLLVLGPIAEPGLRRALLIADYDIWLVFDKTPHGLFLILSMFSLLTPIIRNLFPRKKRSGMIVFKVQGQSTGLKYRISLQNGKHKFEKSLTSKLNSE